MMKKINSYISDIEHPFPLIFLGGLILVNFIAIFNLDFLYIGSFLAFCYMVIIPGYLTLPLLFSKKFPPMFGLALSVALSIFILMIVGLFLNAVLPLVGIPDPLTTVPLLIAFDVVLLLLLIINYDFNKKSSFFEFHSFNLSSLLITIAATLVPLCACLGAIILNNNGSGVLAMMVPLLAVLLVIVVLAISKDKINPSIPPLTLFLIALGFLLTNSMRGWFVSGHDILLEFHVFIITNAANIWDISTYRDPYMACLSLTILPTYIESLLHISLSYMFKFFIQFVAAFPVVVIYYLAKQYVSDKLAFFSAFLYISFPTYIIDMAFLNRQSMAFLFYSLLIFMILNPEYFGSKFKRGVTLMMLGIGVIISHYSTSYVAISIFLAAYIINRIIRVIVRSNRPQWFARLMNKLGNRDMYDRPILLSLPFVVSMLVCMILWSSVVTKTSSSLFNTIQQIITTVQHPFSLDQISGQAHYSLLKAKKSTPEELLTDFVKSSVKQAEISKYQSEFYPLEVTRSYPAIAIPEQPAPLTSIGHKIQSLTHINLNDTYEFLKQTYAKIIQVFLLVGLLGLMLGYSFKKNLLQHVPVEFIALSIAGLTIMVLQTVLPASAINYGLLRLFQQNLIFLTLPIILGLMLISSMVSRRHAIQLGLSAAIILGFFIILSGLLPKITGGGRSMLPLDNRGLYYDSYYTHVEEVASIRWLSLNGDRKISIQAAHFSDMKMLAFGQIGAYIELLPHTTKKKSYEYLNYDNTQTDNILEIINGNVVYYRFPMEFLNNYKGLIYNNGGTKIYR